MTFDGDLYRSGPGGLTFTRAADDADGGSLGTLEIMFARFNVWNEIDSYWEGRFLERLEPGAFADTFIERGPAVKVLYDHGHDFSVGNKVLGAHSDLREAEDGPRAEVDLLDTSYNRDLLPGLIAGLYGASYRFKVTAERWDDDPGRSDHNPEGIKERTIERVSLYEFGPVTFPADEGTTVGMRSTTDRYRTDLHRSGVGAPEAGRDVSGGDVATGRQQSAAASTGEPPVSVVRDRLVVATLNKGR